MTEAQQERDALEALQYGAQNMWSALSDAQWCWAVLSNADYHFWRTTDDDEVTREFEALLDDLVQAQRDYEQGLKQATKAMKRVIRILEA